MTKQELLDSMRRERAAFEVTVAMLDESQLADPSLDGDWSVKDVIAHLAAWEGYCAGWIDVVAGGGSPERPEVADTDATNARDYAAAKEMSLADVRATLHRSHDALLRVTERLSEADLADEKRFGWATWAMIDGNSGEHYREHAAQIERSIAAGS